MQTIIVTDQPKDWEFAHSFVDVVSTDAYLTDPYFSETEYLRVINLNGSYKYQSVGYYVSLLAEARNHKVLPTITTIQDIKSPTLAKVISLEIDEDIQENLNKIKSSEFILSVYFGNNIANKYERLCQKLHKLFPAPLFRVYFKHNQKWYIKRIVPISMAEIPEEHHQYLKKFAEAYFQKKRFHTAKLAKRPYDIAILLNPDELKPPSDEEAILKFINAGEKLGFNVDRIQKDDYKNLPDYDALFIRETTSVNHHTYRIARQAVAEGLVVIDDPESILKCTNKVYLYELLSRNKIYTPKTCIINAKNQQFLSNILSFPCVLKLPDSSFSLGVMKVETEEELEHVLKEFFNHSELILAQEYMPTEFDWRVGILDNQPIYVCRYYMVKNHWQIINWAGKEADEGVFDNVPIEETPPNVLKTALKATKLIGNSLYGVDIKCQGDKAYVIEINDNPSIEAGVEDKLLGDALYEKIMLSFLNRIKHKYGTE